MRIYGIGILLFLLTALVCLYAFNLRLNKSSDGVLDTQNPVEIKGVFEATTPCSPTVPPLPQIPKASKCEMTFWKITFNPDKTYSLLASYGMSEPNTTGIKDGGQQISDAGTWSEEQKTGIISLFSAHAQQSISFIKITNESIHLLDANKNMMVGNGGWSYTLNKKDGNKSSLPRPISTNISRDVISGVFEGRTPCQGFLLSFTKSSVNSSQGCQRIKWLLTFYVDEKTSKPTTYTFGIQGRKESHQGTLSVISGLSSNSNAVVYSLHPNDNRQTISLLQIGNDHLFFLDQDMNLMIGNNYLSYTLSKTATSYETRKSSLSTEDK